MSEAKETYVDQVSDFACPFCTKRGQAGYEGPDREPVVLHEMPPCSQYMDMPADEYLHAVNERLRG